ncbi:TPA: hypothetical protein GXC31_19480 [Escherichia coli]|nr:hypothetical protein [Escherichia coli]
MVNKRTSRQIKNDKRSKEKSQNKKTHTPPKSIASKHTLSEQMQKLFNVNIFMENEDSIFLYFPRPQEYGDELIKWINDHANSKFKIVPFNIAQNSRSWDNIKGIDDFARNNPDVYRKIIARSLMGIYNKIKGFIFTQDWHPAMRLIVDVCREYGITTILIPIEPVFHDKRTYYIDSVSHASTPKTDIVLSCSDLQSRIFSERGYPQDRIYEVGMPKLDIYKESNSLISRGVFCKILGLNENKKIVLFIVHPYSSKSDGCITQEAQIKSIQDILKYTKEKDVQLIVRTSPHVNLEKKIRNEIERSENAIIDDVGVYSIPLEETIYHSDVIASNGNYTNFFEALLLNKKVFFVKYAEFMRGWEDTDISVVSNYCELEALMDVFLAENGGLLQGDKELSARMFSVRKFDSLATNRIVDTLSEFVTSTSTNNLSRMPSAKERFLNKESIDVVAIPSDEKTLCNTQLYLGDLLNSNTLLSTFDKDITLSKLAAVDVFCQWGIKPNSTKRIQREKAKKLGRPVFILEDGFIRSVKIGLSSAPGLSVIIDDSTAYYDATKQSRLERLLQEGPELNNEQKKRARNAINKIVSNRVSKYNDSINVHLPVGRNGVDKVLLIDQRNGDMSVPSALADDSSFELMLANAISNNPDADIIIKQHPDAIKGGKSSYFNNDLIEKYRKISPNIYTVNMDINPYAMFEYVKEVYVVSSGVGFEALMAGKKVYCFGMPFYAGWGLTQDQLYLERRSRKRTLEDIFYFAYIECSRYYNPDEKRVVEVEDIVDFIVKHRKV